MKDVRWMEIYVAPDSATVERIYQLYFGSSLENVTSELRKLQKFSEEEARR
jgi:hypothetical protein